MKEQFKPAMVGIDRETEHDYLSGLIVLAVTMAELSDGDVANTLLQVIDDRIIGTAPEE